MDPASWYPLTCLLTQPPITVLTPPYSATNTSLSITQLPTALSLSTISLTLILSFTHHQFTHHKQNSFTHISLNLSSLSTLRRKKKNKKRIFLFISSSPPPPKTTLTTTIHRRNPPINLHPIKPLHQQLHRFTFKSLPSTPKSTRHSQIENPRRSSHHRPTTFYSLRRRPVHNHFFKILPITGNRRIKPNGASAFSSDLDSRWLKDIWEYLIRNGSLKKTVSRLIFKKLKVGVWFFCCTRTKQHEATPKPQWFEDVERVGISSWCGLLRMQ